MLKISIKRFGLSDKQQKEMKKRKPSLTVLFVIFLTVIVLAFLISILIQYKLCSYVTEEQQATWVSSLASYWGGIIGGVISGALGFLGVFFTIRYYKESDAEKERASILPFLRITSCTPTTPPIKDGFILGSQASGIKRCDKYIEISNIGNGFAYTTVIYSGENFGGRAFKNLITVNGSVKALLRINERELLDGSEMRLGINFEDAKMNEYIQEYTLSLENDEIKIECEYPVLMQK